MDLSSSLFEYYYLAKSYVDSCLDRDVVVGSAEETLITVTTRPFLLSPLAAKRKSMELVS